MSERRRLPDWLTKPIADPAKTRFVRDTLAASGLNTVCNEARCPNRVDCFSRGTATFMILGDRCTRDCRFCAVAHGDAGVPDLREPRRVAEAVRTLGLSYIVITSVTRDDLPDGGAAHFAATVRAIHELCPETGVEVLVPDFGGDTDAVDTVLASRPDVFGHNLETVRRLYDGARAGGNYERSLTVLRYAAASPDAPLVKSSLMVGLGETRLELDGAFMDLRRARVDVLYIGQYLQPTSKHAQVERFIPPAEFDELAEWCRELGFAWVSSGPFVRSSYEAERVIEELGVVAGA
ncbi:lipoyl synthase [bacterium]|nr:lipoyl synthase [bacterium]